MTIELPSGRKIGQPNLLIYCFDLDGTLCTADPDGDYQKAQPFPERIRRVRSLKAAGHTIVIDSARGSVTGKDWGLLTKQQIEEWGIPCDVIRTGQKIYADVYVDDKAVSDKDFFNVSD